MAARQNVVNGTIQTQLNTHDGAHGRGHLKMVLVRVSWCDRQSLGKEDEM